MNDVHANIDAKDATMLQVSEHESDDDAPDMFVPIPIAWYAGESPQAIDEEVESVADEQCSNEEPEALGMDDDLQEPFQEQSSVQRIPTPYAVAIPRSKVSLHMLPLAARELLASSMQRLYYSARLSYSLSRRHRKYTELGNNATGFVIKLQQSSNHSAINDRDVTQSSLDCRRRLPELPSFSSLSWVERQLVDEWRTYRPFDSDTNANAESTVTADDDDLEFALARTLVPLSSPRPAWHKSDACFACRQLFGPSRMRHHCRLCGHSFCQPHSSYSHSLPQLGYDPSVPERVCDSCKGVLLEQNLAERVAWRLARCRDFTQGVMEPYFETGQDSIEQVLLRITEAALAVGRSIPLGAQAAVAVETVDVLRKYGLNGMYTILLRKEFLAAADLLRKALGINQSAWPLSVHELSAAIFYALAQHRAMRGLNPEREHLIHFLRKSNGGKIDLQTRQRGDTELETEPVTENKDLYQSDAAISDLVSDGQIESQSRRSGSSSSHEPTSTSESPAVQPVCDPVSDETLSSLIFYAPMALNFIYATKEVDMQLLAAQQGWRLVYAHMEQESGHKDAERPASALFVHEDQKIACIAIRGTATIHDVITDIRQTPVPFPDEEESPTNKKTEGDWTTVFRGQGLAVCGMAGAALNLYREHIDSILSFARQGYRIRMVGHSLGGGVSVLLGTLVYRDLERELTSSSVPLKVYAYGTPSCIDARLAESVEPFVVTVVLHDDVIPRLTPVSCRNLLKHLLTIRETWVKEHFPEDFMALQERAKTAWAPTFRNSFTLRKSSIKTYCRKQLQYGKRKLLSVTEKLINEGFPCTSGNGVREGASNIETSVDEFSLDESAQESGEMVESLSAVDIVNEDSEEPPRLLLDYMGGIDSRSPGLVIDGDEFFDPNDDLIENSDDESEASYSNLHERETTCTVAETQQLKEETRMADNNPVMVGNDNESDHGTEDEEESPGTVLLEETPLPRMFVPGKIVHIYAHRGVYRCAYVPRAFKELRRISMAGNMLSDHKAKPYYEALLELRTVRQAAEHPPRWTAFDEDDTCSCCASRFTWASTSDSQAQQARDKHNCRSCGTLVCDPCSTNRMALPTIGLCVPSRVCDRCYNDINGLKRGDMTSSFISPATATRSGDHEVLAETNGIKPVRERERRSAVVDELASRVQASPLTCS